ncbi:MAG: uridine kinase [Cyclobacteriaceae bacterium]
MADTPYVVGITGGSVSGITQFVHWVHLLLGSEHSCLISQDHYYRELPVHNQAANRNINFDEPSIIDDEAFAADLEQLKQGNTVKRKEYTFNNPGRIPEILEFKPADVILVEGIFVFHYPSVASQLDLKVFIETKEHLKLHRRIVRDTKERGYPLDDILHMYRSHVAPAYEKYIEPHKHESDLVFPNNREYAEDECPVAADILVSYLKTKLS